MNEVKKFCGDCKTTKTPLWRSGPHGPRSLCNACGIRYRKRKMAEGQQQEQEQEQGQLPNSEFRREKSWSSCRSVDYDEENQMNDQCLKMRVGYSGNLGSRIFAQRSFSSFSSTSSSSLLKKQRSSREKSVNSRSNRNLGEVEQAAVLLMSLSCGSVFA